jgi:hypothetical protein
LKEELADLKASRVTPSPAPPAFDQRSIPAPPARSSQEVPRPKFNALKLDVLDKVCYFAILTGRNHPWVVPIGFYPQRPLKARRPCGIASWNP